MRSHFQPLNTLIRDIQNVYRADNILSNNSGYKVAGDVYGAFALANQRLEPDQASVLAATTHDAYYEAIKTEQKRPILGSGTTIPLAVVNALKEGAKTKLLGRRHNPQSKLKITLRNLMLEKGLHALAGASQKSAAEIARLSPDALVLSEMFQPWEQLILDAQSFVEPSARIQFLTYQQVGLISGVLLSYGLVDIDELTKDYLCWLAYNNSQGPNYETDLSFATYQQRTDSHTIDRAMRLAVEKVIDQIIEVEETITQLNPNTQSKLVYLPQLLNEFSGRPIVVGAGYSGAGYQDEKSYLEFIQSFFKKLKYDDTVAVGGGTPDGFGSGFYQAARGQRMRTVGVVAKKAAQYGFDPNSQDIALIGYHWGGQSDGVFNPTAGTMGPSEGFMKLLQASKSRGVFLVMGGGDVCIEEATMALRQGTPVIVADFKSKRDPDTASAAEILEINFANHPLFHVVSSGEEAAAITNQVMEQGSEY